MSGIIKCGENPFMEAAVKEKNTGKKYEHLHFHFQYCIYESFYPLNLSWITLHAAYKPPEVLVTKKSLCFSCRKELREQLKRQMEEKCVALKLQLASKVKEAENIREVDRLALSSEREQRIQHSKAMTAYRDENKRVPSHTYIIYLPLMLLCLYRLQ